MKVGCWSLLAGALLGAVVGGIIGALVGDPLAAALDISNFEGERGFFIAFVLIPLFLIVGAILGSWVMRRRQRPTLSPKGDDQS